MSQAFGSWQGNNMVAHTLLSAAQTRPSIWPQPAAPWDLLHEAAAQQAYQLEAVISRLDNNAVPTAATDGRPHHDK